MFDMPRRPNGTGTYRRRPSGLVELRLSIGGKQRSYYGSSVQDVDRKAADDRMRFALGLDMSDPNRTVAEYLRSWIGRRKGTIDESTWTGYDGIIRLYLIPHIGEYRLNRLTTERVEDMLIALSATLSPQTVHLARACLRTALNQALARGYILRNAAQHAEAPKLRKGKARAWSPEQVTRLLAAISEERYENIYRFALAVPLRQGEILGLRQSDVDLEAGTARVEGQVRHGRWKDHAKNENSERLVGLPPLAVRAIRAELAAQKRRRLLMREKWTNEAGLIFTTDRGQPIDGTAVTKRLKAICTDAGLPWLRFHGLRHTANSLMHSLGVDTKTRAAILGQDEATNARIYTHALPETIRAAIDRYDTLLGELEQG